MSRTAGQELCLEKVLSEHSLAANSGLRVTHVINPSPRQARPPHLHTFYLGSLSNLTSGILFKEIVNIVLSGYSSPHVKLPETESDHLVYFNWEWLSMAEVLDITRNPVPSHGDVWDQTCMQNRLSPKYSCGTESDHCSFKVSTTNGSPRVVERIKCWRGE